MNTYHVNLTNLPNLPNLIPPFDVKTLLKYKLLIMIYIYIYIYIYIDIYKQFLGKHLLNIKLSWQSQLIESIVSFVTVGWVYSGCKKLIRLNIF